MTQEGGDPVPRLELTDPQSAKRALQRGAVHSSSLRYVHRLHCIVLVAAGHSCGQVSALFGDDPRSIARWVKAFQHSGMEALREPAPRGRPAQLSEMQLRELAQALACAPCAAGQVPRLWSGERLRDEIQQRFGVSFSARHCRRLLPSLLPQPPHSA